MNKSLKPLSEHQHQTNFVRWFRFQYPGLLIFAIPNGGKRSIGLAKKFKDEGVVPGIPDLYIPSIKLWVEMKVEHGGKISKEQRVIIDYLNKHGDTVIIGYGSTDARIKVESFIKNSSDCDWVSNYDK